LKNVVHIQEVAAPEQVVEKVVEEAKEEPAAAAELPAPAEPEQKAEAVPEAIAEPEHKEEELVLEKTIVEEEKPASAPVEEEKTAAAAEVAATPLSSSASDDGGRRCMSARFLGHLERQRQGFVARLNRAMRDRWSDAAVDAALGAPARHACAAYRAATSSTGGQDGHRRHHAG